MNRQRATFAQLVRAARAEPIPPLDVSLKVAGRLAPSRTGADDRLLWVAALLSLAAAATVVIVLEYAQLHAPNPLEDLVRPFVTVIR